MVLDDLSHFLPTVDLWFLTAEAYQGHLPLPEDRLPVIGPLLGPQLLGEHDGSLSPPCIPISDTHGLFEPLRSISPLKRES